MRILKQCTMAVLCMQLVSSQLDPDYVIHTVLDRFGVLNVLTFGQSTIRLRTRHLYRERDHEISMLENALAFLSILLGERINLGTVCLSPVCNLRIFIALIFVSC